MNSPLHYKVFHALENERALDIHYKQLNSNAQLISTPNFKVMKQVAIRNRLGVFYRPGIIVAAFLIPFFNLIIGVYCILYACLGIKRKKKVAYHIIPTTPTNVGLIKTPRLISDLPADQVDLDLFSYSKLCSGNGIMGVLHSFYSWIKLNALIISSKRDSRLDLLLHSYDAMKITLLGRYASTNQDEKYITDDHYQRWAYLLSHSTKNLIIVQHGFLDTSIQFPNPFGQIQLLCVRDRFFAEEFNTYYEITESCVFSRDVLFKKHKESSQLLLLASSFPSIDVEIQFLEQVRRTYTNPIILKLHPSHKYDDRKNLLMEKANYISPPDEYPLCKVFISYNSFMEFDYRAANIDSISIKRLGVQQSLKVLGEFLDKAGG